MCEMWKSDEKFMFTSMLNLSHLKFLKTQTNKKRRIKFI